MMMVQELGRSLFLCALSLKRNAFSQLRTLTGRATLRLVITGTPLLTLLQMV